MSFRLLKQPLSTTLASCWLLVTVLIFIFTQVYRSNINITVWLNSMLRFFQ